MRRDGAKGRGLGILAAVLGAVSLASTASATSFVWPQSGPCTSNFYSQRPWGLHKAVDIAGANRSRVIAGRAGRVVSRGWNSGGYGNLVIIDHGAGYQTYYAHLSAFGAAGSVRRGTVIGYEGTTGNSTGPHVHYELRRYGAQRVMPARVGAFIRQGAAVPVNFPGMP